MEKEHVPLSRQVAAAVTEARTAAGLSQRGLDNKMWEHDPWKVGFSWTATAEAGKNGTCGWLMQAGTFNRIAETLDCRWDVRLVPVCPRCCGRLRLGVCWRCVAEKFRRNR